MYTNQQLYNHINELQSLLEHAISRIELEHIETGSMLLQGWLQDAKQVLSNKQYNNRS